MESLQKQMYVYKFPRNYGAGGQRLLDWKKIKKEECLLPIQPCSSKVSRVPC